ncbi:hypothetical protein [Streptomyces sp. SBT349]|uniref:hypothetical protein n=1 Tax=Streptomyces sp. SBT349 TaxID=1580539 RepID=UPI00066C4C14|nr:hypothetical protein [Streptomyces sp. SBT349]
MDYWPYPAAEADRIDPFDATRPETQYLVLRGSRPSYAFTDPDVFGPSLSEWIPMGYGILRIAQKVAVLRGGQVARQWPVQRRHPLLQPVSSDPEPWWKPDDRHRAWLRGACGYRALTAEGFETADVHDRAAALGAAAGRSREGRTALLLYLFNAMDWH